MPIRFVAMVMTWSVIVSMACNRSVTLFEPTPMLVTEVLTGMVAPPVDGVFQSTFKSYTVGPGGGPVTVTLTSAVQTLPDGTMQATVTMGLGAGTVVSGACVVPATAYVPTPAGTSPQLSGSQPEGSYCIQVSDVTGQSGPVAFSVTVTHP